MPELPEVETIKNALSKAIGHSTILDVIINQNRLRQAIPSDFGKNIIGAKIVSYNRLAKYIVINLSNNNSIIWHLGMSGRIKICESIPEALEKHDHVLIITDNGVLIYNDPRRFGMITYCKTQDIAQLDFVKRIGLDAFSSDLTPAYLKEKFKNKTIPIKEALLDQSIIAGIGNIYASEALYHARISPLRKANQLSAAEYPKLIAAVRLTLEKAIEAGGSTLKDYHKPDGSEGYFQFQHCVYNKTGQPCPDCKCSLAKTGGIRKIVIAGRSSFYCSTLQK